MAATEIDGLTVHFNRPNYSSTESTGDSTFHVSNFCPTHRREAVFVDLYFARLEVSRPTHHRFIEGSYTLYRLELTVDLIKRRFEESREQPPEFT